MESYFGCTAYGKFGRFCRYSFHGSNFLSACTCLAAICYGIWVIWYKKIFSAIFQPTLYVPSAFVMIIVGTTSLFGAALAFYAVTRELRCLMYSFSVANIILFIMLIIGGIMGFVFQFQLKHNALDVQLLATLQNFYGQPRYQQVTDAWDYLQEQLLCCGVKDENNQNFLIWRTSKWHMDYPEAPKKQVPLSCCIKNDHHGEYVDETACQYTDLKNPNQSVLYTKGCYQALLIDLMGVSTIEGVLAISASVTLLVSGFFSALMARLIQK